LVNLLYGAKYSRLDYAPGVGIVYKLRARGSEGAAKKIADEKAKKWAGE
jgi:hypothetical protein